MLRQELTGLHVIPAFVTRGPAADQVELDSRRALGLAELNEPVITIEQYELIAKRHVPQYLMQYIDSGADPELARDANVACFKSVVLVPRVMRAVGKIDTSVDLVPGRLTALADPFFVAPFGLVCFFSTRYDWMDWQSRLVWVD